MAVQSLRDNLPELLESLSIAAEKNNEDILELLDALCIYVENKNNDSFKSSSLLDHLQGFLNWESKTVIARSAKIISELAKTSEGREKCANTKLISSLVKFVKNPKEDVCVLIQVCRALGNICYENDYGRKLVLDTECLPLLLKVLENALSEPHDEGRNLRNVSAGFLLNLLSDNEDVQKKAVDLGIVDVLCNVLELDAANSTGEEACIHTLLILGLLTDSVIGGNDLLGERFYQVAVKVLDKSQSPDVSMMCLELLHSQAENEQVKVHLAKAGLCELLIKPLEKHYPQVEDDETRNLMKLACDLIALVLTGDESMNILYAEGRGRVFHSMISWLSSDDEDLRITGVLAMGNFARTDKHCIQMVEAGVSKKLLTLVEKNNTPDGDIRLQHALLSALRNLVIPSENKAKVLSHGLVGAVTPMLAIPTFPVVFKLLGTLRMVVDGQETVARELGKQQDLVKRLVTWCDTDDHPGVQGEANRLLAWLIKNSRDQDVLKVMMENHAIPCLVKMLSTEYAVMQNEALLALTLTVTMRSDAIPSLVKANIGESLIKLLQDSGNSLAKEVLFNIVSLVEQLRISENMRNHLVQNNIVSVLKPLLLKQNFSDVHVKINDLIASLDSV